MSMYLHSETEVQLIKRIEQYVHALFNMDVTGHDFFHMRRVAHMSREIAVIEQADVFICEVGGWLHDIGDGKLFVNPKSALHNLKLFLQSIGLTRDKIQSIENAIEAISFQKGKIPKTVEGKIIQDADRLDALGAIGIARTFAYGGANDQAMHSDVNDQQTSIQHFYDKLLKLKQTLHTKTAQSLAHERHVFMERFLKQFLTEWGVPIIPHSD